MTVKRLLFAVPVVVLIAIAGWVMYKRSAMTEEAKVRELIEDAASAIEERSLMTCLSKLSPRFRDHWGRDKEVVSVILRQVVLRYQELSIRIRDLYVQLKGDRAEATFMVHVRGARKPGAQEVDLTREAGSDFFRLLLEKEDGEWMIMRSQIGEREAPP